MVPITIADIHVPVA